VAVNSTCCGSHSDKLCQFNSDLRPDLPIFMYFWVQLTGRNEIRR